VNQPMNSEPYRRRFPDPRQWPSNVVYGLYAEVKTEAAVNELSWGWAGLQVADEASRFLAAEQARVERQQKAQAEGWTAGEPGE
jgi:hypothetical protein